MVPHGRLSKLYGSQFFRFVALTVGILLSLGVAASLFTGEWDLPLFIGLIMVIFFVRTIIFIGFVFGPLLAAGFMVWAGYRILFKKHHKKEENTSSETEPQLV